MTHLVGTVRLRGKKYFINQYQVSFVSLIFDKDVVEYTTSGKIAYIKRLIMRKSFRTLAITTGKSLNFPLCPLNEFTTKEEVSEGDRLIVEVTMDSLNIIKNYHNCRKDDKEIIIELYKDVSNYITPNILKIDKVGKIIIDQTSLDTFNIDPEHSTDFDDAISIDGDHIYVHIVDITEHLEHLQHGKDLIAFQRAFTLYLPEGNIDLFENYLDYSLNCNMVRNVITIKINAITDEISEPFYSTIVVKKRYHYGNFESNKYPLLCAYINRHKIVSNISIPNGEMEIDQEGHCVKFTHVYNTDFNHKLIETLMIKFNVHISKMVNIPQRYHKKIYNREDNASEPLNLIDSIKELRTTSRAIYSKKHGHDMLNLVTYTHFTSPIRRYFDIIVHNMLSGITYTNLDEMLEYLSDREYYIAQLVRLYTDWKTDDYYNSHKDTLKDKIIYIPELQMYYLPDLLKEMPNPE